MAGMSDPYALLRESTPRLANLNKDNMWHYMAAYIEPWMRNQDSILKDPYAEALSKECGSALVKLFPQLVDAPDSRAYDTLRTYVMDEALKRHDPAIHQVVMLGAGMITRAFRFKELADSTVFEVQVNADVMAHKEEMMKKLEAKSMAKKRVVLQAQLSDASWQARLLEAGFDKQVPTFWLIESTLQFLKPDEIKRMLQGIDAMSAPHSQLVTERVGGAMDLDFDDEKKVVLLVHNELHNGEDGSVFNGFPWNAELLARRNQKCEYYGTLWDPVKLARCRVDPKKADGGPFFIVLFSKPE